MWTAVRTPAVGKASQDGTERIYGRLRMTSYHKTIAVAGSTGEVLGTLGKIRMWAIKATPPERFQ